ncbi:universal stress protein (plasmid) [Streptomyces sp. NBC_01230]|uniref:universal stress protein n=1 Tax=unclassified Streptomyces TaxID=2593676 RepID=UPI002E1440F8|nr:universal stress protein [Streptomyces sp. NBC_01230]
MNPMGGTVLSYNPTGPVVVGSDGSPHARRAMLFALREAQLRQTSLRVVCAYDLFSTAGRYLDYRYMALMETDGTIYEQLRDTAMQAMADMVEETGQELGGSNVEVKILAEQGRPAEVLLAASDGACLLVVGSRGAGIWGRLTLGSTSTEVVHHAHLPVTVVPPPGPGT